MSSSIFSSRRRSGSAWRRFAATFVLVAGLAPVGLVALAYAIDPYDSGRSSLFAKPGVRPQGPRTAAASRGRDPAFDAAILGNSHVQLLSPERLSAKTGLAFVQLSAPGTGPKEQIVLAGWFLRHHRAPRALVLGADATWCTEDPDLASENPFPFWLFSVSALDYARGLVRLDVLEELPRRLAYVFGARSERARPDGYWDYEADEGRAGAGPLPRTVLDVPPGDGGPARPSERFPAAEALRDLVFALPPDLALVLVFPPTSIAAQPRPGSPRAAADEACKAALRAAVAGRPRASTIDWRRDRPENREPAHYVDETHYRRPIAEAVEDDIAASLRQKGPSRQLGAVSPEIIGKRTAFSSNPSH
jgi:hypothetical protein